MTNITIPAAELLRFGGIEYCMVKKHISSLQGCKVSVTGNPCPLGVTLLNDYLGKAANSSYENKKSSVNQKILDKINSPENKMLWSKMINTYSFFSAKGPLFWKSNYEKIKPQLKNQENENEIISIKKLQLLLGRNPDIENNLISASGKTAPSDFLENSQKLIEALQEITKDKTAHPCSNENYSVLLYSTKLLHPGSEVLFFIQAENGIEVLAPNLNLYLFFPDYETSMIVPYFNYLKNNFINLTKEYAAFVKGTTAADRLNEMKMNKDDELNKITDTSRNLMLKKLQTGISTEQLIKDSITTFTELAATYGLNLNCTKKEESLKFFITLKDNTAANKSFDFSIPKRVIIENYDNTVEMVEKEFQRIAAIII